MAELVERTLVLLSHKIRFTHVFSSAVQYLAVSVSSYSGLKAVTYIAKLFSAEASHIPATNFSF